MGRPSWQRVEEAFAEVVELPSPERRLRLAELRRETPTLAGELDSLLAADADVGDFLDVPAVVPGGSPPKPAAPGMRVGAYVLEREIGQGGMGTVYLARRADDAFEKKVAIKIFGFATARRDLLELFRTERQILATLDHPAIARLLDGGSTELGQPYLVMEYIDGLPIDRFCEERRLAARERIELLLEVAGAVEDAHRHLVVHRDIKPSNILVSADGKPHLLDFGIAKLLTSSGTAGDRLMTPKFASPEQLEDGPITTATDVYALGMLLGVLLHSELATSGAAKPATDLDHILQKALAKDPAERYAAVAAFAEDLRRFLARRPVAARRSTRAYRLRKFVDRHRLGVAVSAAVAFVFLALAGGMTWQAMRLARQRDALARAHMKSVQVQGFLQQLFDLADPTQAQSQAIAARDLLRFGVERVARDLGDQPELEAAVLVAIGEIYSKLGAFAEAEPLLMRSLALRRQLHGERPHVDVAQSLSRIGLLELERGQLQLAEQTLWESQEMLRRTGEEPGGLWADNANGLGVIAYRRERVDEALAFYREALAVYRQYQGRETEEIATLHANLGSLLHRRGEVTEAEAAVRQAIAIFERISEPDSPSVGLQYSNLAVIQIAKQQYAEAEVSLRHALEISQRAFGDEHTQVVFSLLNLGALMRERRRYDLALANYQEGLAMLERLGAAESDTYVVGLNRLGRVYLLVGELGAARESFERAAELAARVLGGQDSRTKEALAGLEEVRRALSASGAQHAP